MARQSVDIAVVGGGMVGTCIAVALAGAGVDVALVERRRIENLTGSDHDGRGSAIAAGSQRILKTLGLWNMLAPHAEPILEIRVADNSSLLHLEFAHTDLGEGPLGWIVENTFIRRGLVAALKRSDILLVDGVEVRRTEFGDRKAGLFLDDGRTLDAGLIVAADGPGSPLRREAGIEVLRWTYPQDAIVCSVSHELPHQGIAHEHFYPAGPFAVLPMTGLRSSIVWTETRTRTDGVMALGDSAFTSELRNRMGDFLGELSPTPGRWRHRLAALHARRYTAPRLALAGDAAHTIHPIAGQGFNMGMRDVAALAEIIVDHMRLGLDPGSPTVLAGYEKSRRHDNLTMLAATDLLNRLFSNNSPPFRTTRRLGLATVNRLKPLKRRFMCEAAGIAGALPRLAREQPL